MYFMSNNGPHYHLAITRPDFGSFFQFSVTRSPCYEAAAATVPLPRHRSVLLPHRLLILPCPAARPLPLLRPRPLDLPNPSQNLRSLFPSPNTHQAAQPRATPGLSRRHALLRHHHRPLLPPLPLPDRNPHLLLPPLNLHLSLSSLHVLPMGLSPNRVRLRLLPPRHLIPSYILHHARPPPPPPPLQTHVHVLPSKDPISLPNLAPSNRPRIPLRHATSPDAVELVRAELHSSPIAARERCGDVCGGNGRAWTAVVAEFEVRH